VSEFRPLLLIRADAGYDIGGGHVMRCLALAQAWRSFGGRVIFASRALPASLRLRLEREACEIETLHQPAGSVADADALVALAERTKADWIALDGYLLGLEFQKRVAIGSTPCLLVDDSNRPRVVRATAILNQNAFARRESYLCDPNTEFLLGVEFALVRREFHEVSSLTAAPNSNLRRVLISFGSADPRDMTSRVLRALDGLNSPNIEFDVVVGDCNPRRRLVAEAAGSRVSWHHNVENMAALMQSADLAIAAAGSTVYELARCGVPMLLVAVAENQVPLGEEMARRRAAVYLGHELELSNERIADEFLAMSFDLGLRGALSQNAKCLIDGNGAKRVARHLIQSLVRFRQADLADAELLYEWQCDPEVRRWSFTGGPENFDAHARWLQSTLGDVNSELWICEAANGAVIGSIRFDHQGDAATAGLLLDAAVRGRGLATTILCAALRRFAKLHPHRSVIALIKPENARSRLAFARAGFEFTQCEAVHGQTAERWLWKANEVSNPKRPVGDDFHLRPLGSPCTPARLGLE
jgi:UDP-2,4-diacetamido-2,4,6-trideoxy-beta-L-altropyranose hydrolase